MLQCRNRNPIEISTPVLRGMRKRKRKDKAEKPDMQIIGELVLCTARAKTSPLSAPCKDATQIAKTQQFTSTSTLTPRHAR